MFVHNVRQAIGELDAEELGQFLKRLRNILRFKYSSNVKPSELKNRVQQFVNGQDPSIQSFEAYLVTLEQLYYEGAYEAMFHGRKMVPKTWRDILLLVTEDQPLPAIIPIDTDDKDIILELKSVFINTVMFCAHRDKGKFLSNLYDFNRFLSIQRDK